jgi:hypothetical protein
MPIRQAGSDDRQDGSYVAAGRLSPQGEFLQGEIMAAYLPGTSIDGLDIPSVLRRNWTTPVCRVLSRLFSCKNPNPSRSPFCGDKKV